MYDLNMQNKQLDDSIVYHKDLKIIYNKSLDGFDSTKIFYKNGLKIRKVTELSEINYFYDAENRLIKRYAVDHHPGGILDLPTPSTIQVYTYEYE
jgi:hypothetical protein